MRQLVVEVTLMRLTSVKDQPFAAKVGRDEHIPAPNLISNLKAIFEIGDVTK